MTKSSRIESYQGKQVFVGVDVHKRTYATVSYTHLTLPTKRIV